MKFTLFAAATLAVAGMASAACEQTYTVAQGDTCYSIAQKFGLETAALQVNNKNLINCDDLQVGQQICVKAPKTHAKRCLAEKKKVAAAAAAAPSTSSSAAASVNTSGKPSAAAVPAAESAALHKANHIVPNCKWFYTITAADNGCDDVAAKNGITTEQFYAWNAGLHHAGDHICDNLDTGKAYCVGV